MAEVGFYVLFIALGVAAFGLTTSLMSAVLGSRPLQQAGQRSTLAVSALLSLAMLLLARLFLADDFSVQYVAEHSSSTTPMLYKFTALWGGQAGSLLLWVWLQSLYASAVVLTNRRKNRELMPYANAVLVGICVFFLATLCFAANPFVRFAVARPEGLGLNPLLQNAMMAIHPPTLYLGYVGFSVPFAFAVAALATGKVDDTWVRTTRRWTLFTWFVLGTGILLGSWWAYLELGWGGYWGWDPVENASIMPWLVGTAFLHSVVIQERRRQLKIWNFTLVSAAFALSILGTFITRSGVISSVHSFAQSNVGFFFLFFLLALIFGSAALIFYRLPDLRAMTRIESIASRESSFLFNNLLFVALTFAILWGTLFPVLSEWVRGVKISVTKDWFNTFSVPIGLALLLLTGIGPLLAWRRSTVRYLLRSFRWPIGVTVAASGLFPLLGIRHLVATVAFTFCVFVLASTAVEFAKGARARIRMYGENAATALVRLTASNKRRWGGYIVHVGMVVIFAGITGSSAFQETTTHVVQPGETFTLGEYTLAYQEIRALSTPRADSYIARLDISAGGERVDTLHPAKEFFPAFRNQPASEVAIHHAFADDLYVVLLSATEDGDATFKHYLNPLVSWIWFGGVILLAGGVITMLPDDREKRFMTQTALAEDRAAA
ncbi:MAG: heme lyase CcmF/NrfE family subunit [Acidobacteriota bacterium]